MATSERPIPAPWAVGDPIDYLTAGREFARGTVIGISDMYVIVRYGKGDEDTSRHSRYSPDDMSELRVARDPWRADASPMTKAQAIGHRARTGHDLRGYYRHREGWLYDLITTCCNTGGAE